MDAPHVPVLLKESVALFAGMHIKTFYEGTVGAGGHAEAFLTEHPEIERYFACDQDESALEIARKRLEPWKEKVVFIHDNFRNIEAHLKEHNVEQVDAFFFDLGVSSMQLDQEKRGFSFSKEGPLDMRMDRSTGATAYQVVNDFSEKDLGELFRDLGEEPRWRRAAQAVARARRKKPIETTRELADIIQEELGVAPRKKIHPATLIFQAIRMYINRELESIQEGVKSAVAHLAHKGRIGVISFHSFEDRIIKNIFRDALKKKANKFKQEQQKEYEDLLELVTKKPIVASLEETRKNRRARSAKLRCAQKG